MSGLVISPTTLSEKGVIVICERNPEKVSKARSSSRSIPRPSNPAMQRKSENKVGNVIDSMAFDMLTQMTNQDQLT